MIMIIINNHNDIIMMIHFWCKLVSRQQKIWETQQAFSWGNVSIFFCILAPSHHDYQLPQYLYSSLAPSPILKDMWILQCELLVGLPLFSFVKLFTIVGWFTPVENSQWCWTLVIHHYIYWEPLEILETDMRGGNHCQNERILFNKIKEVLFKDSILDFHTVILLLLQIIFGW